MQRLKLLAAVCLLLIQLFANSLVAQQSSMPQGGIGETYDRAPEPPIPFDSVMDTKIYGEVKRTDGDTETVFFLRSQPLASPERKLAKGAKFLLLNEWMTPKRSFQKIYVKIISNPPSNLYVGDTGWVELSHTSLYPYHDYALNKIDTDFIYKKYVKAAAKFRAQSDSTCKANKKCYLENAEYFDCLAKSEREHSSPANCKVTNCGIVECPEKKKNNPY